ncbi:MAG: hypothetical protein O9276_04335 [Microcystis sp. LE17-20A]|jgi:hypothetical protein|uniref:DUF3226 domain-containing protein n=1 Tax=unclassified Microcystis TaxID=2643300 RepID=UPI0011950E45|nr:MULTISPECIES: DUF3226 domain-containing protein [unclassified Microcystis]MCZ8037365.1 hypothetical protein [Microcystis sp. LE17-20A]MCZ8211666.1 hypothetical protein [Microcystis sp. LE19-8.1F]TRU08109.1 MAG: hypothetical protein EWV60_14040 [Microcystis sp. Msp_OC_L_20101000_S702]
MPKIETKKLLVEGAEELRVIPQLMEANGVTWNRGEEPLNIINCDGVENLLKPKYISAQLKTPNGLTHLGIVIDADEEPDNRWKSLYNACLPNIPNLPQNLPAAGLIITLESGIKFGVWMMPDNQSRGMLETFLAYLVPDNNLWQYTQNKVIEAKQQGATYRDYHLDKANIHTYLAWQDPPGKQLHDAVKQRILNQSYPQSANFLRWLQELYEI